MYLLACINDVFHLLQQQQTCEEQTKHTHLHTLRERTEAKGPPSLTTQTLGSDEWSLTGSLYRGVIKWRLEREGGMRSKAYIYCLHHSFLVFLGLDVVVFNILAVYCVQIPSL
jgi:hypothetical protein